MSTQANAHVIGHITVKDPAKWAEYRSRVPATLEPWGAELVLRGRLVSVLAGEHAYADTVVIRFPDTAAVNGWYSLPGYQALVSLRNQAAEMVLLSDEASPPASRPARVSSSPPPPPALPVLPSIAGAPAAGYRWGARGGRRRLRPRGTHGTHDVGMQRRCRESRPS
jgi:uncharacterized protein (DUF1330 family)